MPALPSPSPPVHAPSHMHVLRRYVKAGACAHYSACVRMRMRTESACTARLIRSDRSVVCNCTCREHAAYIRRSLQAGACANDSAGEHMRTRTQDACAARFRMVVMGACIATGEQTKCVPWHLATVAIAMPYSARTNREHVLQAQLRACGCAYATWCTGACVTVPTCTCALPFARYILEYARACTSVSPRAMM